MKGARLITLCAWMALVATAVAWLAAEVKVDSDFSAFLPRGRTQAQRIFNRELRDGVASRLLLIELAHDEPRRLAALSLAMARALSADPEFRYVANGEASLGEPELAFIERHRYQLSDRVDAAHFAQPALRDALAERLEGLAGGGGALEKRWLAEDPTGETMHVLSQLSPARQPRRIDGVWFAQDGRAALLVAQTRAPGSDTEGQGKAVAAVEHAFGALRGDGAAQLRYSSPGAMAAESRKLVAADATRLAVVSTVLILGLLFWAYRSVPIVFLCFLPAATGLIAGIVAVSAWFGTVHGITLGFGATLLGEAVDYPSFLLTQVRSGESLSAARTRLGPTLRMAILTTACGSLAFLFADFPGLAQLGLLTMVGILVAGAMTFWVLPLWIDASLVRVPASPAFAGRMRLRAGSGMRLATLAALALVVGALSWNRPWFDDDVAHMNPLPAALLQRDREMRDALDAPDVRYLLFVSGGTRDDVLVHAERLRPHLARWVADGALGGFDLVSDLLPSRVMQARRRESLPDTPTLARDLEAALAGLPFRPGTFAPFVADVAAARTAAPLNLEDMADNAFAARAAALLREEADGAGLPGGGGWYAVVPLRGVADPAAIARAVADIGDSQVRWLDLRAESSEMMAAFRDRAFLYSGLGALSILAVLAHGLRSVPRALRLMAPVVIAIGLTAGSLVAAHAPLSVLHLVALLLVLGVGVNYALFFARAAEAREDAWRTLRTLALVSATTLAAFGVLALSRVGILHTIGVTVCAGVAYSLLCCALLLFAPDPA